jgi:hypothetical protein
LTARGAARGFFPLRGNAPEAASSGVFGACDMWGARRWARERMVIASASKSRVAMHSFPDDKNALSFAVLILSLALEEALKALAEKYGNQPGPWLDEIEELAILRAKGTVSERTQVGQEDTAMSSALDVARVIFAKTRNALPGVSVQEAPR